MKHVISCEHLSAIELFMLLFDVGTIQHILMKKYF